LLNFRPHPLVENMSDDQAVLPTVPVWHRFTVHDMIWGDHQASVLEHGDGTLTVAVPPGTTSLPGQAITQLAAKVHELTAAKIARNR
jgi:hypothetical protein